MTIEGTPTPSELAAAIAQQDQASQTLGIDITEVSADSATATMTVTPAMMNGLGGCHGGVIFTLADAAMAYASNCANDAAVATNATVDFLAGASVGMVLSARCTTSATERKARVHEVVVTADDGTVIAVFHGRTLKVGGTTLERLQAAGETP